MTLLEILVKELPGKGGWPHSVYALEQDDDGMIYDNSSTYRSGFTLPLAIDWLNGMVTVKAYEAALTESKNVAWDGDGLPPIGCECEWEDNTGWTPVIIKYLSNWVVVFSGKCSSGEDVEIAKKLYIDDVKFRPLRSEEERRRDKAINQLARVMAEPDTHNASIVYQAIAAGEIPHVKIV